jgi:hypothetical protein
MIMLTARYPAQHTLVRWATVASAAPTHMTPFILPAAAPVSFKRLVGGGGKDTVFDPPVHALPKRQLTGGCYEFTVNGNLAGSRDQWLAGQKISP